MLWYQRLMTYGNFDRVALWQRSCPSRRSQFRRDETTWRSDIAESAISILSWIVFGHSWCSTRARIIEFRVTGRRFSKLASWAHASLSREITRVKSSRDRSSVFSSPVELAFRCSTDARTLGKRSRCCLRGDRSLSVLYGHVFETRVSFSVDFI